MNNLIAHFIKRFCNKFVNVVRLSFTNQTYKYSPYLSMWYVSSSRLPYVALLPLKGINARLPGLALLFPRSPSRHQ
jgi:hypothetical protein